MKLNITKNKIIYLHLILGQRNNPLIKLLISNSIMTIKLLLSRIEVFEKVEEQSGVNIVDVPLYDDNQQRYYFQY